MVTRIDVLVRLGRGNGDLAKKYYHLGLICKLHVGIALVVTIGYFKDSIILLFTGVAPVVTYLEYIFPFVVIRLGLNALYATLSMILRVTNNSKYLALIQLVCTTLMDLSAGLWLFCTDYNPAYAFMGFLLGRFTATVWCF